MSNSQLMTETIDAYFAGINEERYDDVGALFAGDGRLLAPGTRWREGAGEIADYFRAALKPYPTHLDTPTRVILAGSTATVEIHFSGLTAAGGRLEFDAVDVFDFDSHGAIVRMSSWYDSHTVREQLRELTSGPD